MIARCQVRGVRGRSGGRASQRRQRLVVGLDRDPALLVRARVRVRVRVRLGFGLAYVFGFGFGLGLGCEGVRALGCEGVRV